MSTTPTQLDTTWKLWPTHWAGGSDSVKIDGRNTVWIQSDEHGEICRMCCPPSGPNQVTYLLAHQIVEGVNKQRQVLDLAAKALRVLGALGCDVSTTAEQAVEKVQRLLEEQEALKEQLAAMQAERDRHRADSETRLSIIEDIRFEAGDLDSQWTKEEISANIRKGLAERDAALALIGTYKTNWKEAEASLDALAKAWRLEKESAVAHGSACDPEATGTVALRGWSQAVPDEEGLWWLWTGYETMARPLAVDVLAEPPSGALYVPGFQHGWNDSRSVFDDDFQGAWWMRCDVPAVPETDVRAEVRGRQNLQALKGVPLPDLWKALHMDRPCSLFSALQGAHEALVHLFERHSCDADGWERWHAIRDLLPRLAEDLSQTLKPHVDQLPEKWWASKPGCAACEARAGAWVRKHMEGWHGPRDTWSEGTAEKCHELSGVVLLFAQGFEFPKDEEGDSKP